MDKYHDVPLPAPMADHDEMVQATLDSHERAAAEIEAHADKLLGEAQALAESAKKVADIMRQSGQETIAAIERKLAEIRATAQAIRQASNGALKGNGGSS